MRIALGQTARNALLFVTAATVIAISFLKVEMALMAVIGIFFMVVVIEKPKYCAVLLVLLYPFAQTAYLGQNLGGVPGLKVINVLLILLLGSFLVSRQRSTITLYELFFLAGVLVLHGASVVRSLPYLRTIEPGMGMLDYLNSYLIKYGLYLIPLFVIAAYLRDDEDIELMVNAILKSLALFSCVILATGLFHASSFTEWAPIKYRIMGFFNVHSNDLADFYILGFPLILASFLRKKSIFNGLNLALAMAAVAILYSRTAYVLVILSSLMLLALNRKLKLLPVVAAICLGVVFWSPFSATIIERAGYGLEDSSINTVLSRRLDRSWEPIIDQIKHEPGAFVFGKGFKSVALSRYIDLGHAHNMYLEALLDVGVVGLSFYLLFYGLLLKRIFSRMGRLENPSRAILQAVFVSITAYLISGLTGRHFYPYLSNVYLWVLLGIGLAILKKERPESLAEKREAAPVSGVSSLGARI